MLMGMEIPALNPEATRAGSRVTDDSGFVRLRKLLVRQLRLILAAYKGSTQDLSRSCMVQSSQFRLSGGGPAGWVPFSQGQSCKEIMEYCLLSTHATPFSEKIASSKHNFVLKARFYSKAGGYTVMFRFIAQIIGKSKAMFTEKLNPLNIPTKILLIQISTQGKKTCDYIFYVILEPKQRESWPCLKKGRRHLLPGWASAVP